MPSSRVAHAPVVGWRAQFSSPIRAGLDLNIRLAHRSAMAKAGYVELRCRSAFSFLDGASLPEDLASTAAELGYDALALADVNGVPGAPRFFSAARTAGVRALVGAEVTLRAGLTGGTNTDGGNTIDDVDAAPVLLLVENRTGYRNLCRLLTRVHADRPRGRGTPPMRCWPNMPTD